MEFPRDAAMLPVGSNPPLHEGIAGGTPPGYLPRHSHHTGPREVRPLSDGDSNFITIFSRNPRPGTLCCGEYCTAGYLSSQRTTSSRQTRGTAATLATLKLSVFFHGVLCSVLSPKSVVMRSPLRDEISLRVSSVHPLAAVIRMHVSGAPSLHIPVSRHVSLCRLPSLW